MEDSLFPHQKIREVQDQFLNDVKIALDEKKNFLAHAPTGIGKTTILGPTLAHALKNNKTIFFLTNRHTQHKIVIETLFKIKEKFNLNLKVADFIGKKWMCLQNNVKTLNSNDFSQYCKSLIENKNCSYFLNLKNKNGSLSVESNNALLQINNPLSVEKVIDISEEQKVCPYEITLLKAKESNVIIADYYYILNPSIRENLLAKINKELEDCIIIFDEAHNLPNRIRELLSSNLSTYILEQAINEAIHFNHKNIVEPLEKIQKILNELSQEVPIQETESLIDKKDLVDEINNFIEYPQLIDDLKYIGEKILEEKEKSFIASVSSFLESWLGEDEGFTRILRKTFIKDKPNLILTYKCLDPSTIINDISNKTLIMGMSGTLNPISMYKDILNVEATTKEYTNPFPKDNRLNIIVPETSTKFTKRDNTMYKKIAAKCAYIVNTVRGNSVVFFPSYDLRDSVNNYFQRICHKQIFLEDSKMNKQEKEALIEDFKKQKDHGAVLLATSSGSFGEGIDLPGDLLKGVIIVGLPLAKPNLETKELIKYYEERFNKGWDYGYIFPAMLKTIQNAGRCIRSKEDKGIMVFIDERYLWNNYKRCFPTDWDIKITKDPVPLIERFFEDS